MNISLRQTRVPDVLKSKIPKIYCLSLVVYPGHLEQTLSLTLSAERSVCLFRLFLFLGFQFPEFGGRTIFASSSSLKVIFRSSVLLTDKNVGVGRPGKNVRKRKIKRQRQSESANAGFQFSQKNIFLGEILLKDRHRRKSRKSLKIVISRLSCFPSSFLLSKCCWT
jgi:hypothetical protein